MHIVIPGFIPAPSLFVSLGTSCKDQIWCYRWWFKWAMILPLLLLFLLLKKNIFPPPEDLFPVLIIPSKSNWDTGSMVLHDFVGVWWGNWNAGEQLVVVAMWPSMGHFGTLVVGRAVGLSWHQHGERRSGVHVLQLFRSEFGVCSAD